LYVHAINNADGSRAWRAKPTTRTGSNPGDSNSGAAEASYGWPVIAEIHGYVLVKLRLDWQSLWRPSPWPTTNTAIRSYLQSQPADQTLFVLDLDDGIVPFMANVGHGGFGDGGYMPMGPQPVVKRFTNGQEVVYTVIRGDNRPGNDGRGDSHPGEMVLDDTTIAGLMAGYVRWIDDRGFTNSSGFFPTDEQPNPSMAGDHLFYAHWEAGAAYQITDRSASRGSYQSRISTSVVTAIATSQDTTSCTFSVRHYCSNGLVNTRSYPPGFYIYYRQGAVYDQYWSEYSAWVISNDLVLFVSTDGAVVALEAGNPTSQSSTEWVFDPLQSLPDQSPKLDEAAQGSAPSKAGRLAASDETIIPFDQAESYAGQVKTVGGVIQFVFNNRKAVYLGFQNPHQGAFKARIMSEAWAHFAAPPESLYAVNQLVRVTGLIVWYQGDPVIYVTDPAQIEVVGASR
jgi:hypothetical protein